MSFLLPGGRTFTEGKSYWTYIHYEWLRRQRFEDALEQETFNEYLQEVLDQQEKVERYDQRMEELAALEAYRENVSRLCCFRGIETHKALSLVTEIGDFSRFASARQFSAFMGLVPSEVSSEVSSGNRQWRGSITKAGNIRLRLLLVEAAKALLRSGVYGKKSKPLVARQRSNDPAVISYADRANRRLHRVYGKLLLRGVHHNKATIAVARELSCFVWGMMNDRIV